MTEELIIDGQHVDLKGSRGITLNLRSGLFSDLSKLQTSYSYTITLPSTVNNRRIFDDPGNPSHVSTKTRRMLTARYYVNGIDLLGSSQACVMRVNEEGIEIVLLPSYGEAMRQWIEQNGTLQDLKLPTLTWARDRDADFATSSTSKQEFFPHYLSGLPLSPRYIVGAVSHPVVSFHRLLIAMQDGHQFLDYLSPAVAHDLMNYVILADTRKPSLPMEIASGSSADMLTAYDGVDLRWVSHGWDAMVKEQYGGDSIVTPEEGKFKVFINLLAPEDFVVGDTPLRVRVGSKEREFFFHRDANGREFCSANEEITCAAGEFVTFRFDASFATKAVSYTAYDQAFPAFAIYKTHEHINLAEQNEFPLAVNLANIKQVDFLKNVCAMLGIVAYMTRGGRLALSTYEELLDKSTAQDWTDKIQNIEELTPSMEGFARQNVIQFKEYESDFDLLRYDNVLQVEDATLEASTTLVSLPFSASIQHGQAEALHYAYTKTFNQDTMEDEYTLEDKAITPRVFGWYEESDGSRYLNFVDYLSGEVLKPSRFTKYQQAILHPVKIQASVRLSELDIATLEIQRPVYIRQTGQYYSIISLKYTQESLAEVELIQI
jgi:hypothetical protein